MEAAFFETVERVGREGRLQYACWDEGAFRGLCAGPAWTLWQSIREQRGAGEAFAAYMALAREAIGLEYIDVASVTEAPRGEGRAALPNLVAMFWVRLLPRLMCQHAEGDRVALMARLWNLGEGLLREAPWLNRYVTEMASGLDSFAGVEPFLVRVLEPVLKPVPPAQWCGPFVVTVLDPRPLAERFLPGEMHLVAPAVMCVHDRRDERVHVGLLLEHGRKSRFLGVTACLGGGPLASVPTVLVDENWLLIGSREVTMPMLRRCHRHAVSSGGFVVASAVDSQRLWVAESP
jgi:hypothetical protein